jgi:hypothetical protein
MKFSRSVLVFLLSAIIILSCKKEYSKEDNSIPETPVDSSLQGVLTVWTKKICNGSDNITIKIGNTTKQITAVFSKQPSCSDLGTATFILDKGTYTLSAICGGDTIKFDVNVNGQCTFQEVDYPIAEKDYLPLGLNSSWEYSDWSNSVVTQVFTAGGEEEIERKTYTKFFGSRGNIYYFRKQPPLYYQYRELSFQGFVQDPPSMELVILKDNLQKGASWETPPLDMKISGIVLKVKLVSTIADRDYSEVINGIEYRDLISVNTELFFSPDGIGYLTSGSAYTTVFSKGNGIVRYADMDINIVWEARKISLLP